MFLYPRLGKFVSCLLCVPPAPIFKAIEKVYAIKAVASFLSGPHPLPPSGSLWEGSDSGHSCLLWTEAQTCPWTAASVTRWPLTRARELPPPPRQLALGFSRFIQDRVNGGGGRMGDTLRTLPAPVRERGGSLFLKNINVFICIITSLGHPAGRPVGHRAGKGRGCQGTKSERGGGELRLGVGGGGGLTGLRAGPGIGTAQRGSATAPGARPPPPAAAGRSPSPGRPPAPISGSP